MNAGARLAAFAVVLGVAAGAGAAVGAAVGPEPGGDAQDRRPVQVPSHDVGHSGAEG